MPLRFVLDEQLRGGPLCHAIGRHNAVGINPVDMVRVGDVANLPLGTPDADVLIWAEREDRLVVSRDVHTMPGHLASGRHCPGLLLLRRRALIPDLVFVLAMIAHAGDPADYHDAIEVIP
jgi:Domain of unknown function (DUF5615)